MINILIPSNNYYERKYILDVICNEFLGLNYNIIVSDNVKNYEIILDNNNKLIIEDHFFNNFVSDLSYLNINNLPSKIVYQTNKYNAYICENDIPIIYGKNQPIKLNVYNNYKEIFCSIDIFASSFFMLTRWEEYVNPIKDNHERFSAKNSIAYKYKFLNRPLVNEYVEMFKNMLCTLDPNIKFKSYSKKFFVTCDVDRPFYNLYHLLRNCIGDIVIRHNFKLLLSHIFNNAYSCIQDKSYIFNWYMDICELYNHKVCFYFIVERNHKYNKAYNILNYKIKNLLKTINVRGHEIGLHASYPSYNNFEQIKHEKNKLQKILDNLGIKQEVVGNRQHYLRWDSSITPDLLDAANFKYDTIGSYAENAGFRYGCCYEFSMFSFLKRKKLNLKQRPLIVMEESVIFIDYMNLGYTQKAIDVMLVLKNQCYKYNGNFVLLWHNSHFNNVKDKEFFEILLASS